MTAQMPTSPSAFPPGGQPGVARPAAAPARTLQGTIGPFAQAATPCFADLFPCERLDFELPRHGPIEVTLSWEGDPRALFVQLYWEGRWLAHEDVAPAGGPSRIAFTRPNMEANTYELRIVSRRPEVAIPYRLELEY